MSTKTTGDLGETFACDYLGKLGYKILFRNFRSIFGELDIVANDGNTTVFVEVKKRNSAKYGLPEEAVTPSKISKIHKTIDYFLLKYPEYKNTTLRLDVISIRNQDNSVKIKHIKNIGV